MSEQFENKSEGYEHRTFYSNYRRKLGRTTLKTLLRHRKQRKTNIVKPTKPMPLYPTSDIYQEIPRSPYMSPEGEIYTPPGSTMRFFKIDTPMEDRDKYVEMIMQQFPPVGEPIGDDEPIVQPGQ